MYDGFLFLFVELPQFEILVHVFLDLLCGVEGEVALHFLLNLEIVLVRWPTMPDRDEIIVILLRPS